MEKKSITLLFIISGLIPFYLESFLVYLVNLNDKTLLSTVNEMSYLYGALIVSFLSGMPWQRAIKNKTDKLTLIIPMVPFFFIWFYNTNFFFKKEVIIIDCLSFSLFIDFKFFKNCISQDFLKLRFIVTLLAILSYLI